MIAWALWLLMTPLLVVVDGFLLETIPFRVDLCAAVATFLALFARSRPLPALILALALARAVLSGGGLAAQYLALALPIALVRPLRAVLDERSVLVQSAVAPLMAYAVPRGLELFARLSGQPIDVLPADTASIVAALLLVPFLVHLLGALTPLRVFSTRARRRPRGDA